MNSSRMLGPTPVSPDAIPVGATVLLMLIKLPRSLWEPRLPALGCDAARSIYQTTFKSGPAARPIAGKRGSHRVDRASV